MLVSRDRTDNRMQEADIYINTTNVEMHGPHLVHTREVLEFDESRGMFAMVDSIYLNILHEIGHALGLEHIPVAGNIMHYNYMPKMEEVWEAALWVKSISAQTFGMIQAGPGTLPSDAGLRPFLHERSSMTQYMVLEDEGVNFALREMYTRSVVLGEQDRTALTCIYDFEDWGH